MEWKDVEISPRQRLLDIAILVILAALTAWGIVWLLAVKDQNVWVVAVASGITALTTGFGALPFLFGRCPPAKWVGFGNATAAGLMMGASITLFLEGWSIEDVSYAPLRMGVGAVLGVVGVLVAHRILSGKEDLQDPHSFESGGLVRMILVVGVMTVHSFAEGMGVGVSYGDGNGFGDFIALSIAIHNIPEGLAICLVLIPSGSTVTRGALWSVFSSLPQPLVAIPSFLFVLWFRPLLPVGLGLAAGAMVWMVFYELLPEAKEHLGKTQVMIWMLLGTTAMLLFQQLVG